MTRRGWLAAALVLPTALCLAAACRKARTVHWQEKSVAGLELYGQGRYGDALPVAQEAARLAQEAFGPGDLRTAYALDLLGKVHRQLGRLEKAEELFTSALETGARSLGPDEPKRAHFLDNLAETLMAQGKYDEAEDRYSDSLRLMQRNFGELSVPVSAAYARLATLYTRWGVYEQAEPLIRRLQDINARVGSSDEAADAAVAAARCEIDRRTGEIDRARENCAQALSLRRRLPKNHLDLAEALRGAGLAHLRSGSADEAGRLVRQALAVYKDRPAADPQGLRESLLALAEVEAADGRDAESERLFAEVLPLHENPYALVKAAYRAAGHYQRRGRLDIAEGLYLQALAKQVASPKADKRDREDLLMRLAEVSVGLGRHERAEGFLRRALDVNEEIHGELDPSSAAILAALARVQVARRRFDRAAPWLARLRRLADSRGHGTPTGKGALLRLARLYRDMGRVEKAAGLEALADSGS
jgi:tetratricopeptide (TPR) repeat protein